MVEEYKKKLDEKIKELNSTRVYKKITPLHTKDWYLKWAASAFILIAVCFRSVGIPEMDLWFSVIGTAGWGLVGYLWHDRALILLNGTLTVLLIIGIMNFYYGV